MREQSMTSRLRRAGFHEPKRAQQLLRDPLLEDVTTPAIEDFADVADPDQCLLALLRLAEACRREDLSPYLAECLAGRGRHALLAVLGLSTALGDFLVAHPDVLTHFNAEGFARPESLNLITPAGERKAALVAVGADPGAAHPVATAGAHEAINAMRAHYFTRILAVAAADLTSLDPCAAMPRVAASISHIVGGALEAALAIARGQVAGSERVGLSVIAMGKTGAGELNYVSDVDVVYVARAIGDGHGRETDAGDGRESNVGDGRQLDDTVVATATKLASFVGKAVSAPAGEPALWMLDAGLRPEGKDGPLVRTLASHVAYYERWAKGWEFQALLKARPIAGDLELGRAYLDALWPMVWQASGHENFVEESRAMRRRVEEHVPAKDADRQLKLGKGGLRDVEFTVQLLQLVHGRTDASLRVRPTLEALASLRDGGYVARGDADLLDRAYRTLRVLEHRIQLRRLRRSHLLPTDSEDLRHLARAMRLPGASARDVEDLWQKTRQQVRSLHREIYYRPLLPEAARLSPDDITLQEDAARARLAGIGYRDAAAALRHIRALTEGFSRKAAIQRQLLPVMLGWFAQGPEPDAGLLAFRLLSDRMGRTHWYMKTLRDRGAAAERLCLILASSRYVAEQLPKLPEAISWLEDTGDLTPRSREELEGELDSMLSRRSDPDEIARIGRYMRRRELLRTSMAQVLRSVDAADCRTAISRAADIAVEAGLRAAVAGACERLGYEQPLSRYLIVAMGRMGGQEMGYASDADVVFVHDPLEGADPGEAAKLAGEVAAQVIRRLGEVGSEPALAVDCDLRPEGKNGPLARSLASYGEYIERWAETWERQALLRARPCAGDTHLAERFFALIDPFRYPARGLDAKAEREILRMKARVETERIPRGIGAQRHLKLGRGGLTDVEWTAQLLQLRHAGQHPGLRTTSTLSALRAALDAGIITADEAARLSEAWQLASRLRDLIVLATGRTSASKTDVLPHKLDDLSVICALMGRDSVDKHGIEEEYLRAARRCRADVERIFYGQDQAAPLSR
ncbi:MAG: bifunctional [glutamine synthetase] adenylyltransferase/[glutamine synthetase]-adenylyl-L-tyrosine phosphorylase [Actinomycetaceae bacterium]|nr:bifunctional [glutamine synthetase] adenylyltransferase/[glutamine synthetase]-adenylyl-L-tyrosine phosphorylase [Actinomycetaceae bacterium]